MSAVRFALALAAGFALVAPATEGARAQVSEMEKYVREQMAKARVDCARTVAITRLPDNDIDFIARYGTEKWNAFKDCMRVEMHLDAQHLPPK
jgi:hypothetical protein